MEEEIADLYELIDAILSHKGKLEKDIRAIQEKKRGGFEKRILMDEPPARSQ